MALVDKSVHEQTYPKSKIKLVNVLGISSHSIIKTRILNATFYFNHIKYWTLSRIELDVNQAVVVLHDTAATLCRLNPFFNIGCLFPSQFDFNGLSRLTRSTVNLIQAWTSRTSMSISSCIKFSLHLSAPSSAITYLTIRCLTSVLKGMTEADLIGRDWNQPWHTFWLSISPTNPNH